MKRRTEIIIETERIILIRRRRREQSFLRAWCAACGAESLMLTVDEAAQMLGTSTMNVFRRAEGGQLHWTETPTGALLICRASLLRDGRPPPDSAQE